jgi:uncharacterized membrane protein YhhN
MDAKKKVGLAIVGLLLVALIAIVIVAIVCKWDVGGWLSSPVAIILYVVVGMATIAGLGYLVKSWASNE